MYLILFHTNHEKLKFHLSFINESSILFRKQCWSQLIFIYAWYLINEMTWTIFPGLSFYPVGEVPHLWYISKILYIGTAYLWWLRYNKVIMNLYIYLSLFLFLRIAQSDVLNYYHDVMQILWSFHILWGSKRI